ncbi:neuroendocrine protein 7B2 [Musca domestica]|uniref:Neuroendocrine protein 7B2 n=1 Tax=Musca domestica TaxID=7370 RepID=A0A1I8M7C5_MUSDO|nr:neuroendocrine protein 7B2 [Musca domestica]
MATQFVFLFLTLTAGHFVSAYAPMSKESIFADVLLTELLNRMEKENDPLSNYFDIDTDLPKGLDLVSRSSGQHAPEDYEYRNIFPGGSNPSIRDQELMQHSSLWGHQYVSGGMGEAPNHFPTLIKTDASLPAYCNPPNPCPQGYDQSAGCISDFENTALFSREYQAAQDCTCDSEHMFDCAGQDSSAGNSEMASTMEKFLMHQFQNDNSIDSSNAPVKKHFGISPAVAAVNPFLEGDKLPIAAKKGNHNRIKV